MIMKKVLMFMAIMIAVVSLSSCNSFEDKAKKRLRAKIEEVAKNPETFKIINEKVIFSNDSMCTISFIGSGQNSLGGYNSSEKEYTLIKFPKTYKGGTTYGESLLDMEDQMERRMSIQEAINEIDNDSLDDSQNDYLSIGLKQLKKSVYDYYCTKKGMSKEDAKANYLYIRTIVNLSAIHGKEITL